MQHSFVLVVNLLNCFQPGAPFTDINHMSSKMCDEIPDLFPNFNGETIWEWISNFITLYNGCNYLSMLGLKLIHVNKRGPCWSKVIEWKFPHYILMIVQMIDAAHLHDCVNNSSIPSWRCLICKENQNKTKTTKLTTSFKWYIVDGKCN